MTHYSEGRPKELSFIEHSVIDCEPDTRLRETALAVYRAIKSIPIVDPHTHYPTRQIVENCGWSDPTMLFLGVPGLGFDHYVARIMLAEGVHPELVYGRTHRNDPAPTIKINKLRFSAMLTALERAWPNPSSLWMQAALDEVFDIQLPIGRASAEKIWNLCKESLLSGSYSPQSILERAGVSTALTTDDPSDDLTEHLQHNKHSGIPVLLPTWRADPLLVLENRGRYNFEDWIAALSQAADHPIHTLPDLLQALTARMDYFAHCGCIASDLGFENFVYAPCSEEEANQIFQQRLQSGSASAFDIARWQTFIMRFLSLENARRGWVQYFHQGPLRDTNDSAFQAHGSDIGTDAPGESIDRVAFIQFLNDLNSQKIPTSADGSGLAKTVVFPINAGDYEFVLEAIAGFNGNRAGIRSKLQLGPPWWFNDTAAENAAVIHKIANHGSIKSWIGMLSDARSLPSVIARFQQFRAILAVELSRLLYGQNIEEISLAARQIAYENVVEFLGLES